MILWKNLPFQCLQNSPESLIAPAIALGSSAAAPSPSPRLSTAPARSTLAVGDLVVPLRAWSPLFRSSGLVLSSEAIPPVSPLASCAQIVRRFGSLEWENQYAKFLILRIQPVGVEVGAEVGDATYCLRIGCCATEETLRNGWLTFDPDFWWLRIRSQSFCAAWCPVALSFALALT